MKTALFSQRMPSLPTDHFFQKIGSYNPNFVQNERLRGTIDLSTLTPQDRTRQEGTREKFINSIATSFFTLGNNFVFPCLQKEAAELKRTTEYLDNKGYNSLPPELRKTAYDLVTSHKKRVEYFYFNNRNCTILTGMLVASAIIGSAATPFIGIYYVYYYLTSNPSVQTPSNKIEEENLRQLILHEENQLLCDQQHFIRQMSNRA